MEKILRTLLVDDQADDRALIKRGLRKCQYEVLEASSGEDASKIIDDANDDLDVILLDINMPDVSWFELLNVLRANQKTKVVIRTEFLTLFSLLSNWNILKLTFENTWRSYFRV